MPLCITVYLEGWKTICELNFKCSKPTFERSNEPLEGYPDWIFNFFIAYYLITNLWMISSILMTCYCYPFFIVYFLFPCFKR